MKKFVFLLSFIGLALSSFGQEAAQTENVQSSIVRNHDRYTVDGVTYINSTEFRGYLKNTNPELFAQYNKGYKLGMVGWGLFSYGVVMVPTSVFMFAVSRAHTSTAAGKIEIEHRDGVDAAFGGWIFSFAIASASFCASIPMLGVGYHKMHKSVDVYNVSHSSAAPQTYWSIKTSGNGIGVAYNF